MKTERRHELETNLLASGMDRWKEGLRPYATAILVFVMVVLGGYLAATAYSAYRATRNGEAWDEYQLAVFENDMEMRRLQRAATADDFAGSDMQEWAFMTWADRQLALASDEYLRDRASATDRLTKIAAVYESFVNDASDPEIRNRARLSLARVKEMQDRPKEAIAQYEEVEGPLRDIAADRIEKLKSTSTEDAMKWLATAELPKRVLPPGGGVPGSKPGLESLIPPADAGDLQFDSGKSLEEIISGIEAAQDPSRYDPADKPGTSEGAAPADAAPGEAADEAPTAEAPAGEPAAAEAPASAAPADAPATAAPAAEVPSTAPAADPPAGEAPTEPAATDAPVEK